MKILTVSDKVEDSFFKKYVLRETCQGINLILACGDLPPYYLEYLLNILNVPLYYVPGNHDDKYYHHYSMKSPCVQGCINIDQKVIAFKGLLIGGLGGAFQYRKGKYLYSEVQMHRKISSIVPQLLINKKRYQRYIDILITHAPPFGIHDDNDLPHRGFKVFLDFMDKYKPFYLIHGHTPLRKEAGMSDYHATRVINTNNYRVLEIEDAFIRRQDNQTRK